MLNHPLFRRSGLSALALMCLLCSIARSDDTTLKIYLLAGQSNMEGQAYTWDNFATVDTWNVPSLHYMTNNQAYYNSLPQEVYSFKQAYSADWMTTARTDVWAVNYNNNTVLQVRTTEDLWPGDNSRPVYPTGIQPLSVGFGLNGAIGVASEGTNITPSYIGVELGMGHGLGEALNSPVFLFKSATGGTTLAEDWRPPTAVNDRGGSVGPLYTSMINNFKNFLDGLDADLAGDGKLNAYNNAPGYEVAGFIWLQGWNEVAESGGAFIPEYDENLVDLVEDIRDSDSRIANDLPAVILESADQNAALNTERQAAVDALNAAQPGTAEFVRTDGLKDVNYGGLNVYGVPFSNGYGSHFHVRPENYLEIGYRTAETLLDSGYTGSEIVPEPASLVLLGMGGLALIRRRRGRRYAATDASTPGET